MNVKIVVSAKKDYCCNQSRCICENGKSLKSIADASVISSVADTSVILHTVLLVMIFLLIITIICNHYAKHRSKQKDIDAVTI